MAAAIDGDIADFIEAENLLDVYRTDELRNFLVAEGYTSDEAIAGIERWQDTRFRQGSGGTWETFSLTRMGEAAVAELRSALDRRSR
jgi:hypothetical protein